MYKSTLAIALATATLQAHALGFSAGIGNMFGGLATQSGAQASADSVDQVLQSLSAELNKKMPMKADANTRLDRVSAEPGRHFTYHYTVDSTSALNGVPVDFSKEIKPQLKNQLCSNPDNQKFLKNGITIAYQYRDMNGHDIGDAEFTPKDCGFQT